MPVNQKKRQVAGFLFTPNGRGVVLIRKRRPAWMLQMLNAVGGSIEGDESPYQAMVREFEEETGVRIEMGWRQFAVLDSDHGTTVHLFLHRGQGKEAFRIQCVTDEEVAVYSCKGVAKNDPLPNLPWLIAMAKERLEDDPMKPSRWYEISERNLADG